MKQIQTKQDRKRALDILVKGYHNSIGVIWMLRKKNEGSLRAFFSYGIHLVSKKGGAYLSSDRNGVVFFFRLQNKQKSILNFFRKWYVFLFIMGYKNGIKAYRNKKIVDEIRPKTGWFAWLVATDPEASGKAAGYEIKNEMFRIADETREPIYLETTIPRVLRLYKAIGYIEYHKMKHPYEDITIWFMRREPNPPS